MTLHLTTATIQRCPGVARTTPGVAVTRARSNDVESLHQDPTPSQEQEEWRAIPYFSRYEVSNHGAIRHRRTLRAKLTGDDRGYRNVTLIRDDGRSVRARVHRVVLLAFSGNPPSVNSQARHLNGDRTDNRAVNLAWGSNRENCLDARNHGTWTHGDRHGGAKLTADDVRLIRSLKGIATRKELAARFNIHFHYVTSLQRRDWWKHLA